VRVTSEGLGWALLFSVPVGVGVSLATARMSGRGFTDPLVAGAAVLFAAPLFVVVLTAASVNQGDAPSEEPN
jgi:ABC-type uncharacterized transport system permease subunit